MQDHRRANRQRTFKGGTIAFGGATRVECVIRNLSESGACLEVPNPTVPDQFTLLIRPELINRPCEVAWRSETRIGVRFK